MTFYKAAPVLALILAVGALAAQQTERAPRPGETGRSEAGVEFRAPELEPIAVRQPEPLRVESFDVQVLAEGTHVGEPGDLLLTFHGQGFQATSKSPRVELAGGEVVLEDTMTNLAGTELYVIIPGETAARIAALSLQEVVVRNPGGLADEAYGVARVKASADMLLRPEAEAPGARLVYRQGEFVREPADSTPRTPRLR